MPTMSQKLSATALSNLGGLFAVLFQAGQVSYSDIIDHLYHRGANALSQVLAGFREKLEEWSPDERNTTKALALLKGLMEELADELGELDGADAA